MLEQFKKNIPLLQKVVETDGAIFPIAHHRKEDGSLDVAGNLAVWDRAAAPFYKTYLWENGAPGFDREKTPSQEEPYFIFVPSKSEKPRGTIIVAHGGGFSWRTGSEGFNTGYFFWQAGFNVAILSYRLLPYTRLDAMKDMQRAIRILHMNREAWNLGEKLAGMGFSAGGMLSGNCATHPDDGIEGDQIDAFPARLDAAVIGYGAMSGVSFPAPFMMRGKDPMMGNGPEERMYLAIEKNVKFDTPPMFIWQTMSDDGRHGMCLAKALQDASVPYELHIFTPGVHGLAMADGHNDLGMDIPHITHWGRLCAEWLEDLGF